MESPTYCTLIECVAWRVKPTLIECVNNCKSRARNGFGNLQWELSSFEINYYSSCEKWPLEGLNNSCFYLQRVCFSGHASVPMCLFSWFEGGLRLMPGEIQRLCLLQLISVPLRFCQSDIVKECEILGPLYEDKKITVSSIKNKLDRIFQVTLVRKT